MAEIWWEPGLIGLEIKLYCCYCNMLLPSSHIYIGRGVGTEARGWHGISSLLFLRDLRKIPCFKMYLQFCFYSSMVKPTDEEMTAIEKVHFYSQFPGEGWIPGHVLQDHTRKHQGWSRGQKEWGESMSQSLFFVVVFMERNEWREVGSWVSLHLQPLNTFGRLWVVISCIHLNRP